MLINKEDTIERIRAEMLPGDSAAQRMANVALANAANIVSEMQGRRSCWVAHLHIGNGAEIVCGNCGTETPTGILYPFCPYCGAKMDNET